MVYNKADYSWDWDFEDRIAILKTDGVSPIGAYNTAEQNNLVDTYSDLSYEEYQFTVGGTYNFTPTCYTTAQLTYNVFESDEQYVYGDEDGEAYYGYLGFGYRF